MIVVDAGVFLWFALARFAFSRSCEATVHFSCSNSKRMPIDVTDAIKDVARKFGSILDVEGFIATLERKKKLQFETWS